MRNAERRRISRRKVTALWKQHGMLERVQAVDLGECGVGPGSTALCLGDLQIGELCKSQFYHG